MAKTMSTKLQSFFFLFLCYLTLCSSATQIGFSYDATRRNKGITSPVETVTFLKKNNVLSSEIRVFVADNLNLKTLYKSGVVVDLFYKESETENPRRSIASWLYTNLLVHLPYVNVTSIIVAGGSGSSVSQNQLRSILATMELMYLGLKDFGLEKRVKVSTILPLTMLEDSERHHVHGKDVREVMNFIRKCKSFILLETNINGVLSIGDHFVERMIKSAVSSGNLLWCKDIPIVLNVKSSVVPSAVEVAAFTNRMMVSMRSQTHIADRISGVYAQISPLEVAEQKELNREEEQMFPYSHRELLDDIYPPTPTNIPQLNPVPSIVTVPATNPVIVTPTNPTTNPIAVPATTPITVPPVNPGTSPSMVPPMTVPMSPPTFTNPAPPIGGVPINPPVVTPTVNPTSPPALTNPPTSSGQIWCVAKTGATPSALQAALDYACGLGGADCSAIQPSGSCFNPNNAQGHASYAFNNYYQKNPTPSSCDFKGAAVLVNANPSSGSCIYPASSSSLPSSTPTLPPPPATTSLFPPPVTTSLPPPTTSLPPPTTSLPPPLLLPPPTNPSFSTPPSTTSQNLPPYVLNSSTPEFSPPSIYGSSPPPDLSSSVSSATCLKPLLASMMLVTFILIRMLCST